MTTPTDNLSAFAVSLVFEGGPIVTATYLAPDAMMALALVAVDAARQTGDKKLTGYGVQPIGAEWLRHALNVVEGNEPKASVFSLVSDNLRPGDVTWQDATDHLMPTEAPEPA